METYRGGSTNKGLRRLLRKYAEGGAFYDPMGNVTMPPEEGSAPSLMYEQAMDAIAKAGATVGSPIISALRTAADVYSNKSREAATENEELRRQAMRNMAGDRAGMVPVGAGQMLLSQLGTATLPLTAAAKTIGHAATQATGNPRFGGNVELLSGFVDPSHVGMLKATAPMVGAAAARQAVQAAREVTPVAQATRELSPLGFYSHGAETAANLAQAKGTPDQMTAMLRKYGVKPDEFYSAGIADETATNVMRSKIEREYAPKLAAAKLEMDALGLNENTIDKKSPDYNKALDIRQSPETKAKYQYDSTLNAMRSDMDSAMVLHPEWGARPSVTRDELTQHFNERRPQVEETVLGGRGKPEMDDAAKQKWIEDSAAERAYNSGDLDEIRDWRNASDDIRTWHLDAARYDFNEEMAVNPDFASQFQTIRKNGATKFQQHTLPFGENYREVLLKLPERGTTTGGIAQKLFGRNMDELSIEEGRAVAEEMRRLGPSTQSDFTNSHWGDPNVLAHIRMADRTGPNGEKILHVEEIQSDWGQKGRKEGFKNPQVEARQAEIENALNQLRQEKIDSGMALERKFKEDTHEFNAEYRRLMGPAEDALISSYANRDTGAPEWDIKAYNAASDKVVEQIGHLLAPHEKARDVAQFAIQKEFSAKMALLQQESSALPKVGSTSSAPYVTNTAAWTDLALKRALREAAEGGYDKLVWTPGAEQAKRYSLSNQVDRLQYVKNDNGTYAVVPYKNDRPLHRIERDNIPDKELESLFGRDVAEKMRAYEGDVDGNARSLSGQNLSVGGEGMKAYYDKIIPNQLSKLVKKLDPSVKVGITDVMLSHGLHRMIGRTEPSFAAPGLDITPKMREAIMKGQTDFARGGAVKGYATGGPANNSLEALYNKYAAPTMRQRTRKTVAGIDPERDRDQPVIDPATMGEEWNRARRNYQNFPRQKGEAVARPLELGARDRLAGYIAGGAREPGAQSRRGLADLLLGSTGLPDSGTLGVGVADLPMVTGIPLALADIVHDIGQGDYASTAMGAALPAAFYARGPLGAAGKRAVKIANDYAKPIAGVAGVAATMTPEDAEAAKLRVYWSLGISEALAGSGRPAGVRQILSGTPEENADHIAFLLRNGRGTEVTNALAGAADPITLLRHYLSGGTGAEMPMGRAARIGRAKEGGYHTEKPYYHAGDPTTAFDNSMGELYATTDKSFAKTYRADKNYGDLRSLLSRHQNTIEGDDVIEFFHNKVSSLDRSGVDLKYGWQAFDPDHLHSVGGKPRDALKLLPALKKEGFDSAFFPEDFPPASSYTDPSSSRAFFYPETLRDISARFDPRLSHVSNLDYAQGGEVKNYARGGYVEGYANGGPVSSAAIYDPAEIDALAASIIEGNYA